MKAHQETLSSREGGTIEVPEGWHGLGYALIKRRAAFAAKKGKELKAGCAPGKQGWAFGAPLDDAVELSAVGFEATETGFRYSVDSLDLADPSAEWSVELTFNDAGVLVEAL